MKLKKADLEGVKLANDEYFATPEEVAGRTSWSEPTNRRRKAGALDGKSAST